MRNKTKSKLILWNLILGLNLILLGACGGGSSSGISPGIPPDPRLSCIAVEDDSANNTGNQNFEPQSYFQVDLTNRDDGTTTTIDIPDGRPVYALLVSGFHQNSNFDMFHFYNFAKCILEKGGYVHYSWWNNLLHPYMKGPLHDDDSVPSRGAMPWSDLFNLTAGPTHAKAIPNEDFQFQQDALELLTKIHENNPQAAIILVGHSMGGDAVARLATAADQAGIEIDLLAPIDPVGNRSCIRYEESDIPYDNEGGGPYFCNGAFNFTRWRATHLEWLDPPNVFFWEPEFPDFAPFNPPLRSFSSNVKYLYHRWQQEGSPPFDYGCPLGGYRASGYGPCLSGRQYYEYEFIHPDGVVASIHDGSTNVQSVVATSLLSGFEVRFPDPRGVCDELLIPLPPPLANSGGAVDGHGEIVGFRGVIPCTSDSYPEALKAQGNWPASELNQTESDARIGHLKKWEEDPNYLRDNGFEPIDPSLDMVSGDMCEILRTNVNLQPVADAGPDQSIACVASNVASVLLDGSGSSDPNDDSLTFTWEGPFGIMTGEVINPDIPLGVHSITLTVEDSRGKTDSETVVVDVWQWATRQ